MVSSCFPRLYNVYVFIRDVYIKLSRLFGNTTEHLFHKPSQYVSV